MILIDSTCRPKPRGLDAAAHSAPAGSARAVRRPSEAGAATRLRTIRGSRNTHWNVRARSLLLALALATGVSAPAAARTSANPPGRLVRAPGADLSQPLRASAVTAQAVGLAAGAVQLDSVWYDLQDMGSMGEHVVVGPDGRVHVSWQDEFCELGGQCPPNLSLPNPYPERGQAYAWRDASGTWHNLGKVSDPDVAALHCCANPDPIGGFGSLTLAPGGKVAIAQHINEESCDLRAQFYLQEAVGGTAWSAQLPSFVTPSGNSFLFPQVAATPGGGFTLMGEVPEAGSYAEVNQIGVSWFPSGNTTFSCFNFQGGAWTLPAPTSLFRDGFPAFPAIAAATDGRVGIAVGDFGGNVYLIESSNGSFAAGTITIRNLTNYTDAQVTAADSTSTQYRAYINCAIAYNDTTPNVVWSELQARRVGGVVQFYDWHSRIRHWNSVRGASVVYQVPAGVADSYANIDEGLNGPLCGFNSITVDWPQVGFSEDGSETYIAWLRFVDGEVDPTADMQLTGICTGVGFGDIAASVAQGPAGAWSAPENLTNTPKCDERFFSLAARNPGGRLHLIYQASATDQAGSALIGDRGAAPGNILRRIAYLEKRPAASVLAVTPGASGAGPALRVWPNPVFGSSRVRFEAAPGTPAGRLAEIYGVDGRRIASLPLSSGSVLWDVRSAGGGRVSPGVYFARMSDDPASSAVRFVIAR